MALSGGVGNGKAHPEQGNSTILRGFLDFPVKIS